MRCELLERRLDLIATPGRLVRIDELLLTLEEFPLAAVQVDGELLVVSRHLQPQVARPGMDDQAPHAVRGHVYLDEVVASAERAQRALEASDILELAIAAQLLEVELLLAPVPDAGARGNLVARLVEGGQVDVPHAQVGREHAASNVHTHKIGHYRVRDPHRGSDGAANAVMRVGHDGGIGALREGHAEHRADLLDAFFLYVRRIARRRAVRSLYREHNLLFSDLSL